MPPVKKRTSVNHLLDDFLTRHDLTVFKREGKWSFPNGATFNSKQAAYAAALAQLSILHEIYKQAYIDSLTVG